MGCNGFNEPKGSFVVMERERERAYSKYCSTVYTEALESVASPQCVLVDVDSVSTARSENVILLFCVAMRDSVLSIKTKIKWSNFKDFAC